MRELDINYPIHREEFIKRLKKQSDSWEKNHNETNINGKRGRKPTKPSKNVETKPNTKMYAPTNKFNWFK